VKTQAFTKLSAFLYWNMKRFFCLWLRMFLISINNSIEEIVMVLSRYPLNWCTVLKTRRFESVAIKYVSAECQVSPPHIPSPAYGCMEFTLFYILAMFPTDPVTVMPHPP